MGRAFEYRKARIFARNDKLSKQFTKISKEINIAIKEGGPNPESNYRLKMAIANAKGVNMPKDKVESAIKRASEKGGDDMQEVVYEGFAPHGIAIMVETTTDNSTRTVANVRLAFNKNGGSMGNSGSVDFMFTRYGQFVIDAAAMEGKDQEELELELIDAGLESIETGEEETIILSQFEDFGEMSKKLDSLGIEVKNAELVRIPATQVELTEDQEEEVYKVINMLEDDEDVTNVFHNIK